MKILRLIVSLTLGSVLAVSMVLLAGSREDAPASAHPSVRAPESSTVTIRYVAVSGSDAGDCSDPSSPCFTPQYAVDQAEHGDEVRIASGVYTGVNQYPGLAPSMLNITKSISLRGGFSTSNWSIQDPEVNPTILDAQQQGRVVLLFYPKDVTLSGLEITGGDLNCCYPGDPQAGAGIMSLAQFVTITNNLIYSNTNTGNDGGGVALWGGGLVTNNRIHDNLAATGGGVMIAIHRLSVYLTDNLIAENHALNGGGGLFFQGRTIENVISGNKILSNTTGGHGGGVYMKASSADLWSGNSIADNMSVYSGGGFYIADSSPQLLNNLIVRNHAEWDGGALSIRGSSPALLQNTFSQNTAQDLSGVSLRSTAASTSTATFINNIIVSHTVGISVEVGNTASLEATMWGAGSWANGIDWTGSGAILTGTVNIWGDPDFFDPNGTNYHIGLDSDARDSGVNTGVLFDIDGEPRPFGPRYDIGADELVASFAATKTASQPSIAAGERLTYTLSITNTGLFDLHAVVTDTLPEHVQPTGNLTWTPTITSPGGVWIQQIPVMVEMGYTGWLTNRLEITTIEGVSAVLTNTVRVLEPISGLVAVNDSPTALGDATAFTATVTAGSDVTYAWDFGDQTTGAGPVASHAYSYPGVFQAVVTATNAINALTTTTTVTVVNPIRYLYLPIVPHTVHGARGLDAGIAIPHLFLAETVTAWKPDRLRP